MECFSFQITYVDVVSHPRKHILTKEERAFAKDLMNAFADNDARVAKITIAKNEYESVLFDLRANLTDKAFVSVASPEEL